MSFKDQIIILFLFSVFGARAQYYSVSIVKSPEECGKGSAELNVTGGVEPIRYNWNDGGEGKVRTDLLAGNYLVSIVDFNGKDTTVSLSVERKHCPVSISVVFTPNGDDIQDVLTIGYADKYPNFKFEVFNRWGQRVHMQEKLHVPWDGTQLGIKLPDETYYYVFYFDADNKEEVQTGAITILR